MIMPEGLKIRRYYIRFTDGQEQPVKADSIHKPDGSHRSYRLERDGQVVAEYLSNVVTGWRVEEVTKKI